MRRPKLANSNLVHNLGLPRPIIKSHPKEKVGGCPCIISATAGASDFKFGTQHGFVKTHHKITPLGKSGCGLELGELLKILEFPYISATAGASDFKFVKQLSFVKVHHKITRRRKAGHGLGLGKRPKIRGFLFNIYTMAEAIDFKFGTQLGFAKAHHKITPRGKGRGGLGLGEFLKILGFPILFLQQLGLASLNLASTSRVCQGPP